MVFVVSLWSLLLFWNAFDTALCFNTLCLSGSTSRVDKIKITECTNDTLSFEWSLNISSLSTVWFEYSCINSSNITIQKNHTLVGSDDTHGGKMFIPIPEATYLISACYEDMSSTFHYISPTGCVAIPSTTKPVQITASGDFVSTSVLPLTPNQQFVTLSPANVSPLSGIDARLIAGITVGLATCVMIVVCVLGLISVICWTQAVERKMYQKELKKIGINIAEVVDHNYIPAKVTSATHVQRTSSELSVLDNLEWFPRDGVNCSDTVATCGSFVDEIECKYQCGQEMKMEDVNYSTSTYQEQNTKSTFPDCKVNDESGGNTNSGFLLTSSGYFIVNDSK